MAEAAAPTLNVNVGVLGHVDSGKTSLGEAGGRLGRCGRSSRGGRRSWPPATLRLDCPSPPLLASTTHLPQWRRCRRRCRRRRWTSTRRAVSEASRWTWASLHSRWAVGCGWTLAQWRAVGGCRLAVGCRCLGCGCCYTPPPAHPAFRLPAAACPVRRRCRRRRRWRRRGMAACSLRWSTARGMPPSSAPSSAARRRGGKQPASQRAGGASSQRSRRQLHACGAAFAARFNLHQPADVPPPAAPPTPLPPTPTDHRLDAACGGRQPRHPAADRRVHCHWGGGGVRHGRRA